MSTTTQRTLALHQGTATPPTRMATTHVIEIERVALSSRGMLWRVTFEGQTLIERTRLPALDACRALLAMGHAGTLMMRGKGEITHRLTVNIERGARFTVVDSSTRGLYLEPYKAFRPDDEDDDPPSAQEMPIAAPRGDELLPSDDRQVGDTGQGRTPVLGRIFRRRRVASACARRRTAAWHSVTRRKWTDWTSRPCICSRA